MAIKTLANVTKDVRVSDIATLGSTSSPYIKYPPAVTGKYKINITEKNNNFIILFNTVSFYTRNYISKLF